MNDYQVTLSNGEVVMISAWTPEVARVVAEEEAVERGFLAATVVRVELLESQEVET
jgi:hypothetical protein